MSIAIVGVFMVSVGENMSMALRAAMALNPGAGKILVAIG